MSDDLVNKLYDRMVCSPAQNSCRNDLILNQAADRIEELEAKLEAAFYEGFCAGRDGGWVGGNPTPAWKNSDTLAELKGQNDE